MSSQTLGLPDSRLGLSEVWRSPGLWGAPAATAHAHCARARLASCGVSLAPPSLRQIYVRFLPHSGAAPGSARGEGTGCRGHQCGVGWIRGNQRVLEPPRPFGPKPELRPRPRSPWSTCRVGGIWAPPTRLSDPRKLWRPSVVGPVLRGRGGRRGYQVPARERALLQTPLLPSSACETATAPPRERGNPEEVLQRGSVAG